jgi:serine/threonine protein kinase
MDFIRKLLTPNPKKRITIEQIKKHPFYFQGIEILKERRIEYDEEENHLQALRRLEGLGLIREHLRKGTYNNITTSYYLILNKIKYEKYLEIIDKRKVIINESDYAEEICGTESPVTGYTERKEDIEFLMFK